jgi:NTE family protein
VLAGGAALGAIQAGMVHALYERGIAPDLLIGTSAGALNAAFLTSRPASTATAHEPAALWRGLRRRDILPRRPATLLSGPAGRCAGSPRGTCNSSGWSRRPSRCTWSPSTC